MKKSKKIIAILLCLSMILSIAGCGQKVQAPQSVEEPSKGKTLTPGTYSATANGHNGPVTVETVVDENSIKSVTITELFETAGVQQVINQIPEAIVAEQSVGIDTISGATFASRAVITAVTDCLKQANADIEAWSVKKEDVPPSETEYAADVIVIGAGGSGLASAVSAHQNGASVIVIEKLGMIGGSTVFSGGALNAADPEKSKNTEMTDSNRNSLTKLLTKEPHDDYEANLQKTVQEQYDAHVVAGNAWLFDSAELHALQTYNGGDYEGNPELITVLTQNALPAVQWIESLGVEFQDKLSMATGAIWRRSHYGTEDKYPDGFAAVFGFKDYIDKNDNIEIQLNTKAEELIVEDGKIVGVKAMKGEYPVTYHAKNGVIIATGGFGANVEMRQKYNTQWANLDSSIGCSNQRVAAQGDGIVMAEKAGAQLIDMGLIQLHPNGEVGTGMMMNVPKTSGLNRIFVNNEGKRFVSEDARRDVMVNATYAQPGGTMWVIADGTNYPEGKDAQIENLIKLGKTFKADTVEELAKIIGVDAANLQNSIYQYNAVVDGAEDEFGLTTFDKKLGTPPYYAAKRLPTVHHTMGGIKIDTEGHVIGQDGSLLKGLYAAGEVTGDIHGANRLGGNAIADIAVFGRISGESAAKAK